MAAVFVTLLATIAPCTAVHSRAIQYPSSYGSSDHHLLRGLSSPQPQARDTARVLDTEWTAYTSQQKDQNLHDLLKKQWTPEHQAAFHRFRYLSASLFYMLSRRQFLTTSDGPSPELQVLKNMYSNVRYAAINQWSKLPEQSYIRIVCKELILIILPPADRTVPWTVVEEIGAALFVMTAAGMGGLVTGWYSTLISATLAWYYVAVTAPVPPDVRPPLLYTLPYPNPY